MTLATLLLLHGDDPKMELLYFWSAVLIALTPVLIFGGIAVLVMRGIWKRSREEKGASEQGQRPETSPLKP